MGSTPSFFTETKEIRRSGKYIPRDIHEFDAFNIRFQSIGTSDVYREIEEDDDFIPIDKWITDGLDKWKNIFKNDKEIIKVLNKLKEPFGLIY
ncbi:hypothetical protein LCGC14_2920650, partial [marine sediment metagenome]